MKSVIKIVAAVLVCCMLSTMAFAASPNMPEEPQNWGAPIQVIQSTDENGNEIISKIYFVPDRNGCSARSSSGSGWFKKTEGIGNTNSCTMYAQGYFVWGNGDVSVSSPSGGYSSGVAAVSGEKVDSGTGRYAGVFNKYAYVTYSFMTTNVFGAQQDNSVTIRLSESGNQI